MKALDMLDHEEINTVKLTLTISTKNAKGSLSHDNYQTSQLEAYGIILEAYVILL